MKKFGAICVVGSLLVTLLSAEARAQAPTPGRLNYAICTTPTELKSGTGPLLRPSMQCAGESLTPLAGLARPAFQAPTSQKNADEARRRRRNGLIGLGVGAAAALFILNATSCRNGSDNRQLFMAVCVTPALAAIPAGFFIGRSVGP